VTSQKTTVGSQIVRDSQSDEREGWVGLLSGDIKAYTVQELRP